MDESSLSNYKNLRILSGLEEGEISANINIFQISVISIFQPTFRESGGGGSTFRRFILNLA